ncbi:response regulator [Chromobacterium alticapitis]|uniref:Two-component system response regulator n=1 Tax=Chromobacterium alticapitis TaxID=2073169 RepID=A0A2S5DCL9_9NEIS|nr:response regulator [Chromobacterium alticapitis]POZ60833.1 two-component system response regulator [Chromobacterium alticapitis]
MLALEELLITLAEPSPVQAQIITKSLQELGATQIEIHAGGEELIRQARERRPNLVISAYYLPDMTGSDLVQALRDSADLYDLPFILISSETNPERLENIRQAGSLAILPKPFDNAQLAQAMHSALSFINCSSLGAEVDADMALMSVLIVDDSSTSRHHIRQVLEKLGFEHFCEAASAEAAMPFLEQEPFKLIITDYHMPGINGLEFARRIRASNLQPDTPILMITSHNAQASAEALEDAGIAACCEKPFDIERMRELVRQLLNEY